MFSFVPAYIAYSIILTLGIAGVIFSNNLIKKILSLNIIQAGCLLFYVSICYHTDLSPPIIKNNSTDVIVNPLPQVLMLTAIVVGLATTTIGLAIIMKIAKFHKTIYRSEIDK